MNAHNDHAFDANIRASHQASLDRLSPRVHAQLAQRRNAALRGQAVRRGHGLRYATAGFAALCALAIGLQFGTLPAPVAPVAPALTAPHASASPSIGTMLDEDPEFYAWLASPDAQLVAME
jgi:hypothetical protein